MNSNEEEVKITTSNLKEIEQFTFSAFSSSDSTSVKDSDKKASKKKQQLLILEKFPQISRIFHQKQFKTNPPTPKLKRNKKLAAIELNYNWSQPVEEAFNEENIIDTKKAKGILGYSKLKMITDDEEFNKNYRGRYPNKLDNQWKQRFKSLEALAQVEEEEYEEQYLISKKISAFCDKNEFNENNQQLSRRMSINSSQNAQFFVPSIHEDDELNQESPQEKNSYSGSFSLSNQKLKIDEIDKKNKKALPVSENDLEVLEESKEEKEDEELISKLRNEQKEFLKKIIRGEKLTTVDELLQVMEKEHLCQTVPIEELQEEDENYKKFI